MTNLTKKIINPASVLIEQTAADLASAFFEVGLSQGLKSKHKTHKAFVHHNIERFIPKAVDILIDMLGNPATPDSQKELIREALVERANDPDLVMLTEPITWKEPEVKPIVLTSGETIHDLFKKKKVKHG